MALDISHDVIGIAGQIANVLQNAVGVTGSLRQAALAGPIQINQALIAVETLTSALRWIDGVTSTPGLASAFGVRFGVTPADLPTDWAATRDSGRALANGIYNALPKAADGTVQIYAAPDAVTGERALLNYTLTTAQRNGFTNLYNAFVATIVLT